MPEALKGFARGKQPLQNGVLDEPSRKRTESPQGKPCNKCAFYIAIREMLHKSTPIP